MPAMQESAENRNALIWAKEYFERQHLSKEKIREYLFAQGFTEDETACAMENLPDNFKDNALYQAQWCVEEYLCSKKLLHERLVTKYLFTKEEADYALANLNADFKEIALRFAVKMSNQRYTCFSKNSLHEMLTGKNGYRFTEEESRYVLDHIPIDYKQQALALAATCASEPFFKAKEEIYSYLISEKERYQFTENEAEYAISHLEEALAERKKKRAEELFLQECKKFAPDESAYAMENLDSVAEDFGLNRSEWEDAKEQGNILGKPDDYARTFFGDFLEETEHNNTAPGDMEHESIEKNNGDPSDTEQTSMDNWDNAAEYSEDGLDFPETDFCDPGMIPDPHTCLSYVNEYENWAARARACGQHDLAEQYEEAAAHWRYLYEEAEDEEMEW